jgi:hypothetical protein
MGFLPKGRQDLTTWSNARMLHMMTRSVGGLGFQLTESGAISENDKARIY